MSKRVPGPKDEADFGGGDCYDLALVKRIMQAIEGCCRGEHISPGPASLRDTMLAVAALLHVEAKKLDIAVTKEAAMELENLYEAFAEAAVKQMKVVFETSPIFQRKH